jgi:hypothetical protein
VIARCPETTASDSTSIGSRHASTKSGRLFALRDWIAWTLLGLALGACGGAPPAVASVPGAPTSLQPAVSPYDRREWRHWNDDDHDCQDTRTEVLIAESETPVEFRDERHCKVARGRWTCPFTGQVFTDPRKLDIDHLVPLENAHRSGGWRWSRAKKRAYANDLTEPEHLVAVRASTNRAKGSKGPDEWLPPNLAFVCRYVRDWATVKARWALKGTASEQRAVLRTLVSCK